jgi:selenoprotein W-related protein
MTIVAVDLPVPEPHEPRVSIEYCTQCGWTARAAWIAQELLATFQDDVAEVALVPGTGGVLVVRVDDDVVWDRRDDGFPLPTELKQRIRDRIDPSRDLGHTDRQGGDRQQDSRPDEDGDPTGS